MLVAMVVSCSEGSEPPESASESPLPATDTPTFAISAPSGQVTCAVVTIVCELAAEFLPAVQRIDASAIADNMVAQTLVCPVAPALDSSDATLNALAAACPPKSLQNEAQVYEFNNGKGPFYFGDLQAFRQQVAIVLTSAVPVGSSTSIYAVGCGKAGLGLQPDCDHYSAVVYRNDSGLYLGLVFSRTASGWQVEKVWTPFPTSIQLGESGATIELTTLSEIKLFDLILYEP
jgi:hypothetical protein